MRAELGPKRIWERPEAFGRLADPKHVERSGELGEFGRPGVLDEKGLMLCGPGAMRTAAKLAKQADWMAEKLGLPRLEGWKHQRLAVVDCALQLFGEMGLIAAWCHYESSREPFTLQGRGVMQEGRRTEWIPGLLPVRGTHTFWGQPWAKPLTIDCSGLRFLDGRGRHSRRIVSDVRTRSVLTGRGLLAASFETIQAASPEQDFEDVRLGRTPANMRFRRQGCVNEGRLMNFIRVERGLDISSITFEFCPDSGWLASVRRNIAPLELCALIHPRYEKYLNFLTGGEPPQGIDPFAFFDASPPAGLERNVAERLGDLLVHGPAGGLVAGLIAVRELVRSGSLNKAAGALGVSGNTVVAGRLRAFKALLGTPLYAASDDYKSGRRSSEATAAARAIAEWLDLHPGLLDQLKGR